MSHVTNKFFYEVYVVKTFSTTARLIFETVWLIWFKFSI